MILPGDSKEFQETEEIQETQGLKGQEETRETGYQTLPEYCSEASISSPSAV